MSTAAGGSALVFGAFGAEPVAGGLATTALVADEVNALAGAYIWYFEGDSGPLKSSTLGFVASGAAGILTKGLSGTIASRAPGVTVNKRPSDTTVESVSYGADFGSGYIGQQVCP